MAAVPVHGLFEGGRVMSLEWIRKRYAVPAKRGMRVEYTGGGTKALGTIRGARGGYLSIKLDSSKHARAFHPTWELRYLTEPAPP